MTQLLDNPNSDTYRDPYLDIEMKKVIVNVGNNLVRTFPSLNTVQLRFESMDIQPIGDDSGYQQYCIWTINS